MSFFNYLAMMEIQNYSGTDTKELDTSPAAHSARLCGKTTQLLTLHWDLSYII